MSKSEIQPIEIARTKTVFENNIWLAPMAGTSDLPFRKYCRQWGAGCVVTELVSARGIRYHGITPHQYRYLEIHPDEAPVLIQLFGHKPDDFKAACEAILAHPVLNQCTGIDINMGCPVKKVTTTGAGSALMKDPARAVSIIQAVQSVLKNTHKTISAKFRKGFEAESFTAPDFACRLADTGIDILAVHGRTTKQMYSGKADWDAIAKTKQALLARGYTQPLLGNGDVIDARSAKALFDLSGVDGLMIGRAAMGKPWIFKTIVQSLQGLTVSEPELDEKVIWMRQFAKDLCAWLGEPQAMRELRGRLPHFLKGEKGAAQFRLKASQLTSWMDLDRLLSEYLSN